MGASAVAGVDAPPVLELAEHVLDAVALVIKHGVVGIGAFRFAFGGMQGIVPRWASAARNQ